MWIFRAKKADRLDRLLRGEAIPGSEWLSRQAWDELLASGSVQMKGRKELKAGVLVEAGTEIRVALPGILGLQPADQPAKRIWGSEVGDWALFDKPCGQDTYPHFPWHRNTFANAVVASLAEWPKISAETFARLAEPPRLEGGVLQRLDRDTSGALLVAFTPETKALFRQLFSQAQVEKTYLALVGPVESGLAGTHRLWLATSGGERVRAYSKPPKGEAQEVSVSVEICERSGAGALVRVKTCDGVRHVVRASLALWGAPLVGDRLYGGSALAPFHQLHAESLRLLRPELVPGFPSALRVQPPETFMDSLSRLGLHWGG